MSRTPQPPPPVSRSDLAGSDRLLVGRNPDRVVVKRYTLAARLTHLVAALSMILLALSGLAIFSPHLFFLTALFGGGQMTRMLHPWFGVALALAFILLFIRFVRLNLPAPGDGRWLAQIGDVLRGDEDKLPEVGKYNAGQKLVFWGMTAMVPVLGVTGVLIWQRYFSQYFTIEQMRWALLLHAIAAVVMICIWLGHVIAAIWIAGSIDAMAKGTVSGGWAWRYHRLWLRALAAFGADGRAK